MLTEARLLPLNASSLFRIKLRGGIPCVNLELSDRRLEQITRLFRSIPLAGCPDLEPDTEGDVSGTLVLELLPRSTARLLKIHRESMPKTVVNVHVNEKDEHTYLNRTSPSLITCTSIV